MTLNKNEAAVLWIGPGHRVRTCVGVPIPWLAQYRERVVSEWRGIILGVYRLKAPSLTSTHRGTET
jgi:hypothetical protein